VFVAGFDRPNLFIEVLRVSGDKDKLGRLLAVARSGGPGIVYAATRKNVEKVVAALRVAGVERARVPRRHGGRRTHLGPGAFRSGATLR